MPSHGLSLSSPPGGTIFFLKPKVFIVSSAQHWRSTVVMRMCNSEVPDYSLHCVWYIYIFLPLQMSLKNYKNKLLHYNFYRNSTCKSSPWWNLMDHKNFTGNLCSSTHTMVSCTAKEDMHALQLMWFHYALWHSLSMELSCWDFLI